ncbi:MAG: HAD family hydrolase [Prevotella sp.]|jgi:HAD superfamily hydrolase (TIGR01509 family)
MLQGYFFDLDGVVLNTEPLYSEFWGEMGKKYHPEMPDFAQRIKGQTLDQIFGSYFNGPLEKERTKIQNQLDDFEADMDFPFVPGFREFASWLKDIKAHTALVTSSNQMKMANVYKRYPDFKNMFEAILTAEDFDESKPSPDCYLKAAARFGLDAKDCVGFEDSFNGLKSVRSAGMTVVGLATTNPVDSIRPLSDVVIPDYSNQKELQRFLMEC